MIRLVLPFVALAVMIAPAWWLAGRVQDDTSHPFFRFLCAIGFGLIGYLSFVNLLGRVFGHATLLATTYLVLSAGVAIVLWVRRPDEMSLLPLFASRKQWIPAVLIALVLAVPEWFLTVSTPYWDEVASSSIHLTAPNQFAEGVFPPRHNALPDIPIKYHYAFTILSGSVRWLTDLSANTSIDIVTTCLWLFTMLFVVFWLRDLKFSRATSWWGGFATLLSGGLAWVYLRSVEAYDNFEVAPPPSMLKLKYDAAQSAWQNLIGQAIVPSTHLRNADGSLSNLPWDIASQFQQHAVAMGIPLTIFAFYVLIRWLDRGGYRMHFVVTVLTFGILILGHAVFGGAAAVTAGLVMLMLWFRQPTRAGFMRVTVFTILVTVLAIAHGGPFATGEVYGANSDVLTMRSGFGYPKGGISGFINWNLAGFGVPLLLALLAWIVRPQRTLDADPADADGRGDGVRVRQLAFLVFTVFTVFSYLIPQFTFYTSQTSGIEQFTEISKFFFSAHLGFALVSVFGVGYLLRGRHWSVVAPAYALSAITPLMFVYVHSTTALDAKTLKNARGDSLQAAGYSWLGFYRSPYYRNSIEENAGDTLRKLKRSSTETFYDASRDERRHGFMNELLIFGGSVFTVTPSRFERTGSGFRLAQEPVAERLVQNSRIARLRPGSAEACNCRWFYTRPEPDMMFAPMVVRSRFAKAVEEGYFTSRYAGAGRVLYSIDKATRDIDDNIYLYWRPRIVSQTRTDWNGDGRSDLIYFDYVNKKVLAGSAVIDVPAEVAEELSQLFVGRFPGDGRVSLLFARLRDTDFRLGRRIDDIIEQTNWAWSYRPASASKWDPEYPRWNWDIDVPLVGDLDNDGFDTHLTYQPSSGAWYMAPATRLVGPSMPESDYPLPFVGRFLPGSNGDLALWSRRTGMVAMQSLATGRRADFKWGGNPGEVLVPADYDGDGYDEIAVWNGTNQFWYFRRPPDGVITQFRFGTATSVPLPADYNNDGRADPAYWEPRANKIFVTFSAGRSVDLVITVPPHTIPAFVNMY